MSDTEVLFRDLTGYLKPEDVVQLQSALAFSEQAHQGQFRQSGEPYISHPVAVAHILAQWHMDSQALTAALLHDVMEDTSITKTEISERFGKMVADLVDGVSKLDRFEFETQQQAQAENFRKMLLAMARDVRVILIKLADRLHNMRTLDAVSPRKRKRIARETMDIYAPIANRLGLNNLYQELEELSFRNLYPNRFKVLSKALKAARGNRREIVDRILESIRRRLADSAIEAQVSGREKNLFSIYSKMQEKGLSFAQVYDIYGFRVIVKDVPACYLALGALHQLYKPIPGKFKDYVAIQKANGYQSLHSSLIGPFGTPIEIQIRTQEMHRLAEAGVASHWLYKEHDASLTELQLKTHQWLQGLLEMQSESGDSAEFLEHLKVDLFPDEVYVFTPKGKIMAMPHGATAVDFSYAVHTDIGNRCVAVKINNELMPLRSVLRNGDRVEIITATEAKPNPGWLNFVVTGKARSHIRHCLKTMQHDESAHMGERLLNQALKALQIDSETVDDKNWERLLKETGKRTRQDMLADIGLGKQLAVVVARKLLNRSNAKSTALSHPGTLMIRGSEGMALQFAKCCNPIPGDPIVGFISKGQGMIIHTHDCPVIAKPRTAPEKWLDVEWAADIRGQFQVKILLSVSNQPGVLAKVASAIADTGSNIENVSQASGESSDYTDMQFTLQVSNRMHLADIMRGLRRIPEVMRINRVRS